MDSKNKWVSNCLEQKKQQTKQTNRKDSTDKDTKIIIFCVSVAIQLSCLELSFFIYKYSFQS